MSHRLKFDTISGYKQSQQAMKAEKFWRTEAHYEHS